MVLTVRQMLSVDPSFCINILVLTPLDLLVPSAAVELAMSPAFWECGIEVISRWNCKGKLDSVMCSVASGSRDDGWMVLCEVTGLGARFVVGRS